MKKFLLSLAVVTLGFSAYADTVTFNFKENDYGLERKSGSASDGYLEENQQISLDKVTLTFNGGWRLWTDGLREYYKNGASFTVSVETGYKVTAVSWTVVSGATFALEGTTNNITSWEGEASSVKFVTTASANKAVETITVTYEEGEAQGGGSTEPSTPTAETIYSESFGSSLGDFNIYEEDLPDGLNYVWAFDAAYGAKASAYVGGTRYDVESWLVSPVIDLTSYENVTLSFDHAANYLSGNPVSDYCQIYVGEADTTPSVSTWTDLSDSITYPVGSNWTFVNSGEVSLAAFEGKKIIVGFLYISTSSISPTWEVKNFVVKGTKSDDTVGVSTIGNENAPVEFFNLNGVKVANPENGIFIRRQGNKATKVVIR